MRMRLLAAPVHRIVRQAWRWISGYNNIRKERIIRRRQKRAFDEAERKLEELKERCTGIEKIRCINDIHMIQVQRRFFKV